MANISEALQIAVGHHQAGRLDLAAEIYRRILAAQPNHVDALHLLGVVANQVGQHELAIEYIARAIGLNGTVAAFHSNLGNAFQDQGKPLEAVACCRRALELKPDYAEAHSNLGNAFKDQGKLDEAIACYRRALELKPDFAEAHNNLGTALTHQGKPLEAVACYRRALELKPDYAKAHSNLGHAFTHQGKPLEAIACCRRALELKPDYAEAHNNLGIALKDQGKLVEAVACYRRALELKPDLAEAHNNLGTALSDQGKLVEAVACYRRALARKPDYAKAHSNLLSALQYQAGVTLSELAAAHAEYERLHAGPLRTTWRRHANVRDPQRRLRVGFVSPDFGRHPVGYFLIRGLENLDRGQSETVCYCDRRIQDDLTTRFQAAAAIWRDVRGLSDSELAETIRADGIDILFDLAGHTARNRLLAFARKPAPIQITWIGYEGTTGLSAMDYLLADRSTVPQPAEHYYREHVLRLPDGYLCYDPPAGAPATGPLPARERGHVTFGSFNHLAKITPAVVGLWAEILGRVPESRLVLKHQGLNDVSTRLGYEGLFAAQRIDPGRLELLGWSPYQEMLAEYNGIDIGLDPFPFSGSATTCEALWMGVPVITCPGETFASRHSLSHLRTVGLRGTIARDFDEYVKIAQRLAADLPRLAEIRAGLRVRVAESPLCDGKRFAGNWMQLLRGVWRDWCNGSEST